MPIGPVGDFISVDEKYKDFIGTAEWLTSKYLKAYLCFNSNDESTLKQILKQHLPGAEVNQIQIINLKWGTQETVNHFFDFYKFCRDKSEYILHHR